MKMGSTRKFWPTWVVVVWQDFKLFLANRILNYFWPTWVTIMTIIEKNSCGSLLISFCSTTEICYKISKIEVKDVNKKDDLNFKIMHYITRSHHALTPRAHTTRARARTHHTRALGHTTHARSHTPHTRARTRHTRALTHARAHTRIYYACIMT